MKHNKFSLKGWLMIAASLALTVLSFATPALAQQPTGAIEGTISDQSGAVLASAKILITEKATGRVIEVATNSGGYFVARALLPGTYDVKVEHAGFSAGRVENVVVQTGQVSSVNVGLKVGATTEVVQVEGTSAQLQVDTSRQTIDGVVTAQQIAQLPLNQRNFLDPERSRNEEPSAARRHPKAFEDQALLQPSANAQRVERQPDLARAEKPAPEMDATRAEDGHTAPVKRHQSIV